MGGGGRGCGMVVGWMGREGEIGCGVLVVFWMDIINNKGKGRGLVRSGDVGVGV